MNPHTPLIWKLECLCGFVAEHEDQVMASALFNVHALEHEEGG